jgi:hypothetical protein
VSIVLLYRTHLDALRFSIIRAAAARVLGLGQHLSFNRAQLHSHMIIFSLYVHACLCLLMPTASALYLKVKRSHFSSGEDRALSAVSNLTRVITLNLLFGNAGARSSQESGTDAGKSRDMCVWRIQVV